MRKRVFVKTITRELTLFAFEIWHKAQQHSFSTALLEPSIAEEVGRCDIFAGSNGLLSSYVDKNLFLTANKLIKKRIDEDKNFFPGVFNECDRYLKAIKKIWKKGTLKNHDELFSFFHLNIAVWPAMTYALYFPALPFIPESLKKIAWKYRTAGDILADASDRVIRNTLLKLYPRLGELSFFLSVNEIRNNQMPSIKELKKRKKWYFLYGGEIHLGNLAIFAKKNHIDLPINTATADSVIKEFRGAVAFPGLVNGRVRIITGREQISSFKSKEILVAIMTTPDYIPAMKKASAFITDEGGITCHAAIIAREIKKPCIIGTKVATKVLKNGDLVEVDADNGVVKIIHEDQPTEKEDKIDLFYVGNSWFMTITRNMSFWHQSLSNEGHFHHTKDFGVNAKLRILHITKGGTETSLFMCNPNYTEYSEAVINAVSTEKKIANLKKKYFESAEKLTSALDNAKQNLNKSSFAVFLGEYRRFTAGLMITATLGRSGAEKLTARLKELSYEDEEISEINAVVTYPKEHTPLFISQLDLLKIGILVQDGKPKEKIDKALSEWVQEHGYIPVNFCEDPWTISDARRQLDNFLKKNCKEEYRLAEKSHSERTENTKRLLDKIGDKEVSILAYAIAEGTFLNEFRKNIFSKVSLGYRGIFEKIALGGGSKNWRDCFYLTPSEMLDVVSGKSISILDIMKERRVAGARVNEKEESVLINKGIVEKFYDYIAKAHSVAREQFSMDKIIKGSSANKGVVRGVVRVVLSSKDFHKLNTGEILVTAMTSVDFVPVMGRASAFVTNEGGITSHASIVAREMNKPCIIGTKIATRVLKDGDLVEVDANIGVVKILNKYEQSNLF